MWLLYYISTVALIEELGGLFNPINADVGSLEIVEMGLLEQILIWDTWSIKLQCKERQWL